MSAGNTVVVFQYKNLEYLTPVMSLLEVLRACGREVVYLGVHSDAGEKFLRERGVEAHFMPYDHALYRNPGIVRKVTHRMARAAAFPGHRAWAAGQLERLRERRGPFTIWFSEIQSAASSKT